MEQNINAMDFEQYLEKVDPLLLMKKIRKFRETNIRNMNDGQLMQAINEVLCFQGIFQYAVNIRALPKESLFYRVRKMKDFKTIMDQMTTIGAFWEPPAKFVHEWGRLNKPNEPLLYTALDIQGAIDELHIADEDWFVLIKYKSLEEVKINWIGGQYNDDQLRIQSPKARLIHEIYNNFLKDEFSRDVGVGTEYLYRISENIAKAYFDLPPRAVQDAWCYASIQDKSKCNVCFRPEIAHDLLHLEGAMICRKIHDNLACYRMLTIGENGKIYGCNVGETGAVGQNQIFPELMRL